MIVGDVQGLFRAETTLTKAVSQTCLGILGYNDTLATLDAFRVDLFMAKDTPETGTGSYTVKLIAEVNLRSFLYLSRIALWSIVGFKSNLLRGAQFESSPIYSNLELSIE